MNKTYISDDLPKPPNYAHAVLVNNSEVLFTAGAVPIDENGVVIGRNDLDKQVEIVCNNLITILEANSFKLSDIVKSTIYVVSDDNKVLARAWNKIKDIGLANSQIAATLVGVNSLGYEDQLVEIELVASK